MTTEQQRAAARGDAVALVAALIRNDHEGCAVIIANANPEALAMTLAMIVRLQLAGTGTDLDRWAAEAPVRWAGMTNPVR